MRGCFLLTQAQIPTPCSLSDIGNGSWSPRLAACLRQLYGVAGGPVTVWILLFLRSLVLSKNFMNKKKHKTPKQTNNKAGRDVLAEHKCCAYIWVKIGSPRWNFYTGVRSVWITSLSWHRKGNVALLVVKRSPGSPMPVQFARGQTRNRKRGMC